MRRAFLWSSSVLLAIALVLFNTPRYTEDDDAAMVAHMSRGRQQHEHEQLITVMSFNMRLDMLEADPCNHFTQRVHRIARLFDNVRPWLAGLQEPFAGQLLHLQSVLAPHYAALGYNRNGNDLGHPSRHNDFQVGMLYDSSVLTLIEQDYMWLSTTPRVPETKSWGAMGTRTLNVALFNVKDGPCAGAEIIAFNTHLDVQSEEARRGQSAIVAEVISEWQLKHPHAAVILFGDFNSAPGQWAHRTLTGRGLTDAWIECKAHPSTCTSNSFCSTFHGWLGVTMNSYAARVVQALAFTLSGLGMHLPHAVPLTPREWIRACAQIVSTAPQYSLWESLPSWPWSRLHVDWILYSPPAESTALSFEPSFVAVMDVRSSNYSSDHYPVVAVFNLNKQT